MNYDLGLLGFDQVELAKLLDPGLKNGLCDPDEVPAPPDQAITRPGDLWLLGDHRLLCGDSAKAADVDRLVDGQPIHLVNTDPPYNVKCRTQVEQRDCRRPLLIRDDTSSKGRMENGPPSRSQPTTRKLRARDRPLANDFLSEEQFDRLLYAWFGNLARVLLPGHTAYIFGGYGNCGNYPPVLKASGLYFSQAIIWDKQHPVLTRKDFMGAHEWAFTAGKKVPPIAFSGPTTPPTCGRSRRSTRSTWSI